MTLACILCGILGIATAIIEALIPFLLDIGSRRRAENRVIYAQIERWRNY